MPKKPSPPEHIPLKGEWAVYDHSRTKKPRPWRCAWFGCDWGPCVDAASWAECQRCGKRMTVPPKRPSVTAGTVIEPVTVTFIAFSGVAVAECRSYSVDRDVITCRGARFIVKPSDAHRWKRDRDTKDAEHPGTGDLAFIPPSESDAVRIVDSYVYAFSVSGDTLRTIAFMNDKGRVMQIVTGETT